MSDGGPQATTGVPDAIWAAAVLALDAGAIGGVWLKPGVGPASADWIAFARSLQLPGAPWRRLPPHVGVDRLIGGLDLAATLASGRPIVAHGLLAEATGGVVVVPMAERLPAATAAHLAAVIDTHHVLVERDGMTDRHPARIGVIACDEGCGDESISPILADRLAIQLALTSDETVPDPCVWRASIEEARERGIAVVVPAPVYEAVCVAALRMGISSLMAPLHTVRVARLAASLRGCSEIGDDDLSIAARLVLAPRATVIPIPEQPAEDAQQPEHAPTDPSERATDDSSDVSAAALANLVVDAVRAALPPGLLAALSSATNRRDASQSTSRRGAKPAPAKRGRAVGTRRGLPHRGARLDLIETLRAAAPWQRLRRVANPGSTIAVRADDFRIRRFKQRAGSTTIFVVDASGSTALHRLAEAKGAVELLLADCYVRRDEVALVAFSGRGAEILLPPTRAPARARRSLADLSGGGGTPLAAGLDAAALLADAVVRRGQSAGLVVLTDGKANISRAGAAGRSAAEADALAAAQCMRGRNLACIVVDTAPRPQAQAARLAETLGARYLPLPNADAGSLSLAAQTQRVRRAQ